jgi:hypothetical protein
MLQPSAPLPSRDDAAFDEKLRLVRALRPEGCSGHSALVVAASAVAVRVSVRERLGDSDGATVVGRDASSHADRTMAHARLRARTRMVESS